MKYWLFAILTSCAFATAVAQPKAEPAGQDALAAIDDCIEKLDAALDVGYERIAARCPHLSLRLEQSGWAEWLPRGWKEARNDLSAGSLDELRALVARELGASVGTHVPRVERLDAVLVKLGPVAREHTSLWARFRSWLRTVVERNRQTPNASWLDEMLERNGRSQTFIDLLTYMTLVLLVGLAGFIIVNEMRAAGLLRLRPRTSATHSALEPQPRGQLSWQDIERATVADKPRLLLELVIARLTQLRRLPPSGALTVREMTRTVDLPDAADRERLLDVAMTAERARYSGANLMPETVNETVTRAQELLSRLDKPA